MDMPKNQDLPYVIVAVQNTLFAFSSGSVRSIVTLDSVVSLPQVPDYVRGMINLRGEVLPVVDLRQRLGYKALSQEAHELCEMLTQRQQEHLNWLAELKGSVKEGREFTLATDPHQCKFGKWYDNFSTTNADLDNILRRFDEPHKAIHGIAIEVKELEKRGEYEKAMQRIEITESTQLARMVNLFGATCQYLEHELKEIAVILERGNGNKPFAVAVDQVISVEKFQDDTMEDASDPVFGAGQGDHRTVAGLARRARTGDLVQILDPEMLIEEREIELAAAAG